MKSESSKHLWGVDLGGTKIEGVILEWREGVYHEIFRDRLATEADQGYEHVLHRIELLIRKLESESGLTMESLGIGTPGKLDHKSGMLKNSNSTCLNGNPFLNDLERKLKVRIKMENDANCFALSEAKEFEKGNGKQEAVFGVIMGTGVGGGLIAHGQIVSGKHGIAGEWGHNFLDDAGEDCYCGRHGCTETIISGPALERYYHKQSGQKLRLKEIMSRARSKEDVFAVKTFDRLIHFFGKGIAQIINVIDPSVVIVGGGVGNIDELYTDGVAAILPHLFNDYLDTKVVKPVLGDSSGVFGAAYLNLK